MQCDNDINYKCNILLKNIMNTHLYYTVSDIIQYIYIQPEPIHYRLYRKHKSMQASHWSHFQLESDSIPSCCIGVEHTVYQLHIPFNSLIQLVLSYHPTLHYTTLHYTTLHSITSCQEILR